MLTLWAFSTSMTGCEATIAVITQTWDAHRACLPIDQ